MNLNDMPYRLWAGDDKITTGLKCLFTPQCAFCDIGMQFWSVTPQKFSINDGTKEKKSHAMDIVLWCPECGHINLFGVAVSGDHYEYIQRRLKFLPHKEGSRVSPKSL